MRHALALVFAVSAGGAQASELGFPASALVEAGQSELFAAASTVTLRADLDSLKSVEKADSAKPDEKTVKYTGKCYAKVDGDVRIDGPCPVEWKTGEGLSVSLHADDGKVEPAKNASAGVAREGRKWFAYWRDVAQETGGQAAPDRQDLGEVRKHGSCWSNQRVRICERDS
jgi:hypothetical protein